MANTTDMELASLNSDMSLACEIKHDDKLTDEVRKLKLFILKQAERLKSRERRPEVDRLEGQ